MSFVRSSAIIAVMVVALLGQAPTGVAATPIVRIDLGSTLGACADAVAAAASSLQVTMSGQKSCNGWHQSAESVPKPGDTRTVPCDPTGTGPVNEVCSAMNACLTDAQIGAAPVPGWHVEERQRLDTTGQWSPYGIGCRQEQPGLDPQLIQDQIAQLAPHADIKAAPPDGHTLVNIQTIYWLDTPPTRTFGPLTLLGHTVTITLYADSTTWIFGDGSTARSNGPGRPFGPHDHCQTAQCPTWFGHTYTATGALTVTATPHWSASYTIDGTGPQDIPGTVNGPDTTLPMQILEARSVLVPNPPPANPQREAPLDSPGSRPGDG